MKRLNLIIPILTLFILFGCKEDPVKPKTVEFDSPRFNWDSVMVPPGGYAGIWAMETSKVFLLHFDNKALLIESGGNVSSYPFGNYKLNDIKGISNFEVYLFGISDYPDNKLTILKWNGTGFEYYDTEILVYTGLNSDIKGLCVSSNEIWILSRQGIVKFDGINMHRYSYGDTLLKPKDIFLSDENKVQYIAERWDSQKIQDCLYEFRDTGFVKIFDHTENPNQTMSYTFLKEINGYKYGFQPNEPLTSGWTVCMFNFNGSGFSSYFCFPDILNTPHVIDHKSQVGQNLQDFIYVTEAADFGFFEHTRIGIVHWNGSKISKELELSYTDWQLYYEDILFRINLNSYLVYEPGYSKLFFGNRK